MDESLRGALVAVDAGREGGPGLAAGEGNIFERLGVVVAVLAKGATSFSFVAWEKLPERTGERDGSFAASCSGCCGRDRKLT